jgi:hypothetical protein
MPCLVTTLPIQEFEARALEFRRRFAPGVTGALGVERLETIVEFELLLELVPMPGLIAGVGTRAALSSDGRHILIDAEFFGKQSLDYYQVLLHEACHGILHRQFIPPTPPRTERAFVTFHDSVDRHTARVVEFEATELAQRIAMPTAELQPVFALAYDRAQDRYDRLSDAAERHITIDVAEHFGVTIRWAQSRLRDLWRMERDIKSPTVHAVGGMVPRGALQAELLRRRAA